MEKKRLILLILLLSGCAKEHSYACSRIDGKKRIDLNILIKGDVILSVEKTERYLLPYDLLLNEEWFEQFSRQLDEDCFFQDNELFCRCMITPEGQFSFVKTAEQLKQQRFICE